MADNWLNDAFNLIADKEGFSATPYWDVNAWRIGYGSDTITRPDGTIVKVVKTTPAITKADAGRDLSRRIPEFAKTVIGQIGQDKWDALPDKTRGPMVSVGYNYGSLPDSLTTTIKSGADPVDIAVGIAKLGANKGINNPGRRVDEASYSLQNGPQMASNNDDPFSAAFGPKAAAPPAPAAAKPEVDDAFSAAFKPAAPVKPGAAASIMAGVGATAAGAKTVGQTAPPTKGNVASDMFRLLGIPISDANEGARRGAQDVGDTVSNWGIRGAAMAAGAAADKGWVDPKLAKGLDEAATSWDKTTEAGRKEWEAAHPATSWGVIPTDAGSWGRLAGQVAATGGPLGKGVSMLGKGVETIATNPLVKGMISGPAVGAAQAALTSRSNDEPLANQVAAGGVLGGLFAGAAPLVVKAGKSLADKLFGTTGYSDKALSTFNGYLKELGITPKQAQTELAKLGPDATYADLDAALRTRAAALAGRGGETTSAMKKFYGDRQQEGAARTAAKVDEILGPAPDVTKMVGDIEDAASVAGGPHYKAAYASNTKLDAQPVVDFIDGKLKTAKGDTAGALEKAKQLLYTGGKLDEDLAQLHSARIELDAVIRKAEKNPAADTTAHDRALGAMRDVRREIDKVLKTNPDMAAGDAAYASVIKTKQSFETGQEVFKNATRKEDLERLVATATPEQLEMLRAGTRAAINDALENTARGELSALETLFGKKSANRAKLELIFPDKVDEIIDLVRANAAMRNTEHKILSPSATAELTQAQKEFQTAPKSLDEWLGSMMAGYYGMTKGGEAVGLAAATAFKAAANAVHNLEKRGVELSAKDVARILSAPEAERKLIVNALARNATRTKVSGATKKGFDLAARGAAGGSQQKNLPAFNPFGPNYAPRAVALPK